MLTQRLTLADLARSLKARAELLERLDLSPALRAVGVLLGSAARQNFQKQSAPDGTPWAPLLRPRSRPRDKRGRKRGGTQQILLDTGTLRASITSLGSRDNVFLVERNAVLVGTRVKYAPFHQHGTRKMVARPFLGWSPELLRKARRILADFVRRTLSGLP